MESFHLLLCSASEIMIDLQDITPEPEQIEYLGYQMARFGSSDPEAQRIDKIQPQYSQICPYCKTKLKSVLSKDHGSWGYITFACYGCGWYCGVETSEIHPFYCDSAILKANLLRGPIPSEEIARALLQQRDLAYKIDPIDLEKAVTATLGTLFDCRAEHVGGSHDGGIDVLLLDGETQAVVQVKRRSRRSAVESVSIIREFLGAMVLSQSKYGVFVSTADHFSREAVQAAQSAQQLGVIEKMDLIDSSRLVSLLKLAWLQKSPPWAGFVEAQQRETRG